MMSATAPHRSPLLHPDQFFIDGRWVDGAGSSSIDVLAPATEILFHRVATAEPGDMGRAVAAARAAFDHGPWPLLSHQERAGYLRAIATELDRRTTAIADVWTNEMGIVNSLAERFAPGSAATYRAYADFADSYEFEAEQRTTAGAKAGYLIGEPVGVVGIIVPWNGPMHSIAIKLAPALLAGCTAVIKAAPEAPGHALILAEICEAVGLPAGVVNVLTADRAVSEHLVTDRDVDKIAFTGSTAAGLRIASLLGGRMARYTMELGGKSAAIILDDYDVEDAAQAIALNASRLNGQICAALSRVIIPEARHDMMLEALAAHFGGLRVGDPFDADSHVGPLAFRGHRDRVAGYIEKARQDGFRLAAGGGRPANLGRGFYIEPTVFGGVDNRSVIAQEEVFGPVLCLIPARDEEHAVDLANDSIFGLAGSVFTHDPDRAYAVARKMRTGTVSQNGLGADFGIGFGGFKQSGIGREGGLAGLHAFLEPKTILLTGTLSKFSSPDVS